MPIERPYVFPGTWHDFMINMESNSDLPESGTEQTVHFVLIHFNISPGCNPVINPVAIPAEIDQHLSVFEQPIGYSSIRVVRKHPPNAVGEHWILYE